MKKFYLFLITAAMFSICHAQNTAWPSTGNVGIGTTTPNAPLEVSGATNVQLGNNNAVVINVPTASYNALNFQMAGTMNWINNLEANGSLYWYDGAVRVTFQQGGNVGIGTAAPAAPLHVGFDSSTIPGVLIGGGSSATNFIGFAANRAMVGYDASSNLALTAGSGKGIEFFVNGTNGTFPSGTEAMYITNAGNLGLGTTSPGTATRLQVAGMGLFTGGTDDPGDGTSNGVEVGYNTTGNYGFIRAIQTGVTNQKLFLGNGNVGIGTFSPDALLSVKGIIHTQEVKVDMTGWSDYVFKPAYKLPKLSAVKSYIDENHHLPEMPSEKEVVDKGIKLTEMLQLQQKKIEELTLYLIQQQSQLAEQQQQINQLKRKSLKQSKS